jgi:hypothetical protein
VTDTPSAYYLGDAIRVRLDQLEMTQTEVAARLNLHPSVVTLWYGNRRPVPEHRLSSLAEALLLDVDALVAQAGYPPPKRVPVAPVQPADEPEPVQVRSWGERLQAYTLAPLTGPSPVPGRPRGKADAHG